MLDPKPSAVLHRYVFGLQLMEWIRFASIFEPEKYDRTQMVEPKWLGLAGWAEKIEPRGDKNNFALCLD